MAATDEILRLMRNIRVDVPGALDDVIKLKLFDAVSDFMDRSLVAYEEDTFTTVADQLEYDVSVTGPYQITRLLSLADAQGNEIGATMDVPGVVKLTSLPSGGNVYTYTLGIKPIDPVDSDGYVQCPDWIIQRYRDVISAGVRGMLFAMPNKPYSNERLAIYHTRVFNAGIGSAKVDAARRNRYRSNQWAFPPFA